MYNAFGMFDFLTAMMPFFFMLVIGLILFSWFRDMKQWRNNNQQPRLTVVATVKGKRTRISGGVGEVPAHTSYFVTFQVASGDRMELKVSGFDYGQLAEEDCGHLSFQGTRFLRFER